MTPTSHKHRLERLRADLGHKALSRAWAKAEILVGLSAAGAGLLLGVWAVGRPVGEGEWLAALAGLALFVLGGYLALAGSRSHLYQSNNELIAYLIEELTRPQRQGEPSP